MIVIQGNRANRFPRVVGLHVDVRWVIPAIGYFIYSFQSDLKLIMFKFDFKYFIFIPITNTTMGLICITVLGPFSHLLLLNQYLMKLLRRERVVLQLNIVTIIDSPLLSLNFNL